MRTPREIERLVALAMCAALLTSCGSVPASPDQITAVFVYWTGHVAALHVDMPGSRGGEAEPIARDHDERRTR